ncbi:MAG: hypothetical protein ACI8W1_000399 [Candidatus Azotimanducaceae bacterium]|jgi:hypothetical protein
MFVPLFEANSTFCLRLAAHLRARSTCLSPEEFASYGQCLTRPAILTIQFSEITHIFAEAINLHYGP